MPPKVCPRCGEEYLATITTCGACQLALVHPDQLPEDPEGLPASEELVGIRVEHPAWIEVLAERLAEQGIPSRVELLDADTPAGRRADAPCSLRVRPEDAERARGIDQELLRAQIPDLPEGTSADWTETEDCPACGTALEADAAECPECGLCFGESA